MVEPYRDSPLMIIICPNCTTHFNVDPTVLGGGKNARCFNCSHSWFQEPVSVPPPAMPQMASYPAMAQPMQGQPILGEQPGVRPLRQHSLASSYNLESRPSECFTSSR